MKLPWPFSQSAFRKIGKRVVDKIDTYRTPAPDLRAPLEQANARQRAEIDRLNHLLDEAYAANERQRIAYHTPLTLERRRVPLLLQRIEVLRQALADIVTGNAMPPNVPVPDGILHAANAALKADDLERQRDKEAS